MIYWLNAEQRLNKIYKYVWIWSCFIEFFMQVDNEYFEIFNSLINFLRSNNLASSTLSRRHKHLKAREIKKNERSNKLIKVLPLSPE